LRVIVLEPFAGQFFAGTAAFDLAARNLFGVVRALDALGPGFAEAAEAGAAIAVDGAMVADWSQPLVEAQEILIVLKIAGG
jgi:hypothetical protein